MTLALLPHDPYSIFRGSRTPAGLYARQKWLQEGLSERWRGDFNRTVSELFTGQAGNGSWQDSALETVRRLFGLHLTVRQREPRVERAMEWLLASASAARTEPGARLLTREDLRGLPFAPAPRPQFHLPATLFLAALFGMHADTRVSGLYAELIAHFSEGEEPSQTAAAVHNLFRALVVHPLHGAHAVTRMVVDWLAERQTAEGEWGPELPFHQTLNALAHLDAIEDRGQLEAAFDRLSRTQHADGTWGGPEREWKAFLAVHALKNKGHL